jgi:arylsulfatase A-like enzyme
MVDAANADPGLTMDGRSLLPVIRHPGITGDRELLIERPPEASRPSVPSFAAIRTRRYLYSEHSTGETELYDLRNDPFELRSLHDDPDFAPLKGRLSRELHRLEDCAGSACERRFSP